MPFVEMDPDELKQILNDVQSMVNGMPAWLEQPAPRMKTRLESMDVPPRRNSRWASLWAQGFAAGEGGTGVEATYRWKSAPLFSTV